MGVLVERTIGYSRDGLRVDVSLYENGGAVLRDGGLPFLWSTTYEDVCGLKVLLSLSSYFLLAACTTWHCAVAATRCLRWVHAADTDAVFGLYALRAQGWIFETLWYYF